MFECLCFLFVLCNSLSMRTSIKRSSLDKTLTNLSAPDILHLKILCYFKLNFLGNLTTLELVIA